MTLRVAAPLAALALAFALAPASLATTEPTARVVYLDGTPRIELSGSWAGSRYRVSRAASADGAPDELLASDALCTGECYAFDWAAEPGRTYWYRFELWLPDGSTARFGPFALAIAPGLARPIGATVRPNPSGGAATVRLTLAGRPGAAGIEADASVFDLSGRRVATLHRGPMAPGARTIAWDGRDANGAALESGSYWLRFRAADGRQSVTRIVRIR